MTVEYVLGLLNQLEKTQSKFGPFKFKYCEQSIRLLNGRDEILRRWNHNIYLIAAPKELISGEEPSSPSIWYIGKTTSSLSDRIKSHVGNQIDGKFSDHRWAKLEKIDGDIRGIIESGNVDIYTIEIIPDDSLKPEQKSLLPELIEKYLLVMFALEFGELPVLNLQF